MSGFIGDRSRKAEEGQRSHKSDAGRGRADLDTDRQLNFALAITTAKSLTDSWELNHFPGSGPEVAPAYLPVANKPPSCVSRDRPATPSNFMHRLAKGTLVLVTAHGLPHSCACSNQILCFKLCLQPSVRHRGGDQAWRPKDSLHDQHCRKHFPCAGLHLSAYDTSVKEILQFVDRN